MSAHSKEAAGFNVIGRPVAMVDARQKTTGAAIYTDDLSVPGMLIGKILHSPHPHARIRKIDSSRALAMPGVRCVVTGADAPMPYGILPIGKDECALQPDKVRYIGDNVACVVATTERIAEEALLGIRVEYDVLPHYFDAESAMRASTEGWLHAERPSNIEKEYHHTFGDPEGAMQHAKVVCERRYICPAVTHVAMEPHSTLARFENDENSITVWSSTQVPYYLQLTLSRVLNLPMERIRVIKPMVGGGFGGKSEVCPLEVIASIASRKAGAPVKITYTREEVFYTHRGRPEQVTDLKVGALEDGQIISVIARVVQDGGAYCGYGPVTLLYSGALLGAMYDIRNVRWDGYRVLTNKPACGAMRGHGTVDMRFAFECLLDEVAQQLGMNPAEVRRRNLLRAPYETVNNLRVLSYGLPECIDIVLQKSGWSERHAERRQTGPRRRGLGLACSHYVSGAANPINRSDQPHSTVRIEADSTGRVTIYTGTAEIGQGSDTMQAQIVAECLGLPLDSIQVIAADSSVTPVDLGSYSSRVTMMAGNAVLHAAENLKRKIAALLSEKWQCSADTIVFRAITVGSAELGEWIPFREAVSEVVLHANGKKIEATGTYTPPTGARGGTFKGAGVGPSPAYSYSAQVAEVSVDEQTGEVAVHKIWAAHDCGRALNPVTVEGQVIGSVWMGVGQALSEEMKYTKSGQLENPSMLEYRVPSTIESPEIDCSIIESVDPEGPYGAKEAGEGSLAAAIPAIANAIFDAVGVRLYETPFTADKILKALSDKTRRQNVLMGTTSR